MTQYYSFSTLLLMMLREVRFSRNLTQADVARRLGKVASAYNKIETGLSTLSMQTFFQFCTVMECNPSTIMTCIERHAAALYAAGFHCDNEGVRSDDLLPLLLTFFNERLYPVVLSDPSFHTHIVDSLAWSANYQMPVPLRYCIDTQFRTLVDKEHRERQKLGKKDKA